jgi:hypothetical protein
MGCDKKSVYIGEYLLSEKVGHISFTHQLAHP